MTRSLPSTTALTAFESAAFHLSVTQAAKELNLTQGAVSRQIRNLESHLGVELFTRQRQRIRLTQAGTQYLEHVRAAFDRLEAAELALRATRRGGGVLQLALLPTYGTLWLIPRFPSFAQRHPAIQVHFTTRLRPFDFATEDLDAAIHYGEQHWPGAQLDRLMDEEVVAVCTAAYRDQQRLAGFDDLRRATLLQISTRPHAFHDWLVAKGAASFDGRRGPRFEHHSMVLQAALAGLGVALLPAFVVDAHLRQGALCEAVPDAHHLTGKSYWLVYPDDRAELPALRHFRSWLLREHGRGEPPGAAT